MKKEFLLTGSMNVLTGKVGGLQITTPAGPSVTVAAMFSSNKPTVSLNLLEDYSFTEVLASVLTPKNKFRSLTSVSGTAIKAYTDITAVAGADQLTLETIAVEAAANGLTFQEWVLKASTHYLLAFSNANAATAAVGYNITLKEQ